MPYCFRAKVIPEFDRYKRFAQFKYESLFFIGVLFKSKYFKNLIEKSPYGREV